MEWMVCIHVKQGKESEMGMGRMGRAGEGKSWRRKARQGGKESSFICPATHLYLTKHAQARVQVQERVQEQVQFVWVQTQLEVQAPTQTKASV